MNKIHRTIWNEATSCWTAAPECAKGRTRGAGRATVTGAALAIWLAAGLQVAAWAGDGGRGGGSLPGAGGTAGSPNGGDWDAATFDGTGGGGAGMDLDTPTAGKGGDASFNSGGAAGSVGMVGGNGLPQGGGGSGGGGGGAGAVFSGGVYAPPAASVVGGAGGVGGDGAGGGGGGGGGGAGLLGNTSSVVALPSGMQVIGGRGGNGGRAAAGTPVAQGGAGGSGVAAFNVYTVTNEGSIAGGQGGLAGSGTTAHGAGGVGLNLRAVPGQSLDVVNSGTISGGLDGGGTVRADAIVMDANLGGLTLQTGSLLNGNVRFTGGNGILAVQGSGSEDANFYGFQSVQAATNATWSLSGAWTLGAMQFITADFGATLTLSGNVSGAGSMQLTGMGTVVLSGTNTFGGGVTVQNGTTLRINRAANLGSGALTLQGGRLLADSSLSLAGQVYLSSYGTFDTNGFNVNLAGPVQQSGGSANFSKDGVGTLTLQSASNSYHYAIVNQGTLAVNGSVLGAARANVGAGATLDLSRANGATTLSELNGAGTVALGNRTLTLSSPSTNRTLSATLQDGGIGGGTGASVLFNSAGGSWTVNTAQSYTGGTFVDAGTLALSGNGRLTQGGALSVASGATVDWSGMTGFPWQSIGALSGAGTLAMGGKYLEVNSNNDSNFTGTIQGGDALSKGGTGTLQLNGSGSFSVSNVAAGTLLVGGNAASAAARLEGEVTVATGATLGGHGSIGGDVTVTSGAHLSPGGTGAGNSMGTLKVEGDLTLASGAQLDFDFGTPGASLSVPGVSDSVVVGGNFEIGQSTLNVSNAGIGVGLYKLFSWTGSLSVYGGGFAPPPGMTLQFLLGSKQINLINTTGYTLNFWNANGLASGTQLGGGDGTWSRSSSTWADEDGAHTGPMTPQPNFAIFGGAAGLVTVDNSAGNVAASGMQFASDGYRLTGGALALVANPSNPAPVEIRVGDGSAASAAWNASIANSLTGTDGLLKTGAGTLTLSGTNTYTGGTTVRAGTLRIGSDGNLGAAGQGVTLDGGALSIAGASAPVTTSRQFTLGAAGGTLDLGTNGVLASNGGITGAGGLTVTGAGGTLTLASANDYTGGTTVAAGAGVELPNVSGALGSGDVLLRDTGSKLTFAGTSHAGNNTYVIGRAGTTDILNRMSFAGSSSADTAHITINGSGSQAQPAGVANTLLFGDSSSAGDARIDNIGGTVRFAGNATASRATVQQAAGSLLDVADITSAGGIAIGSLSGAGSVVLGGTKLTLGGLGRGDMLAATISDKGSVSGSTATGGSLVKVGAGTLTLSGANTYTGGTVLKEGRIDVGHDSALGTGTLAMDDGTTLGFAANKLTLSNAIYMTGSKDPVIDTGRFDATLAGAITGAGFLTKVGAGTLTLSGANSYTGATNVAEGTLRAGAAYTFSPASAMSVASGATLDLAGHSQTLQSLTNAGTVSLVGSAPGTVLTVTGPWVGNGGTLALGVALSGNDTQTDRLVLDGSAAVASGSTLVRLTNLAGLGGQTTGNGIAIVTTQNGASIQDGAFSLSGTVSAGAYDYHLATKDGGAYLSSILSAAAATPVPTYRAEAPLLAAAPEQLREAGLAMVGNLHQRVGDEVRNGTTGSQRQAWGRYISVDRDIAQEGTVSPTSSGRQSGVQVGTDLWGNPNWRAGIYVGQLEGELDVTGFSRGTQNYAAGSNDLRSQFLGGYATWRNDGGTYVDTVLQGGRLRYTAHPVAAASTEGKGSSVLASVEVGQALQVAPGWVLEPQLQLASQHLDLDDLSLAGATVRQHNDSTWLARIGVRVKGEVATGAGLLQPYARVNVYRRSSGTDTARFIGPAATTDILSSKGGTSTELAVGATWQVRPLVAAYGEVGRLWANTGAARTDGSVGGSLGLRVQW